MHLSSKHIEKIISEMKKCTARLRGIYSKRMISRITPRLFQHFILGMITILPYPSLTRAGLQTDSRLMSYDV